MTSVGWAEAAEGVGGELLDLWLSFSLTLSFPLFHLALTFSGLGDTE